MFLSLDNPAGILIKTTCVDYPGILACSFFLKGCNLQCPYCYNTALINTVETNIQTEEAAFSTVQELFNLMKKRQGILKGIVISGGEPLLNPFTPIIIREAKKQGYKVKLDTNGTLPEKLEAIINDTDLKPDFIAMDIKTSTDRYSTELCSTSSSFYGNTKYFVSALKKSIDLISKYKTENREFRTVMVPGLVTKADIKNIAQILPEDASWQFAEFKNGSCLNPEYNNKIPYTDAEAAELVDYARTFISGAALR